MIRHENVLWLSSGMHCQLFRCDPIARPYHDKTITKPKSWGDEFVEVPVTGCDSFTFYKNVPKPKKSKRK